LAPSAACSSKRIHAPGRAVTLVRRIVEDPQGRLHPPDRHEAVARLHTNSQPADRGHGPGAAQIDPSAVARGEMAGSPKPRRRLSEVPAAARVSRSPALVGWLPPALSSMRVAAGNRSVAGQMPWGGWGSNPRPADYEKYGPPLRMHYLHKYHAVVPPIALIAPLARLTRSTNRSTPDHGDHRMPATERYRRPDLICQGYGRRAT
jgi:hypothetical protein